MESDNRSDSLKRHIQMALYHYALGLRAAGIPGIANSVEELNASLEGKTLSLTPLEKSRLCLRDSMLPEHSSIVSGPLLSGQIKTIQTALYYYGLLQQSAGALHIARSVLQLRALLERKTLRLAPPFR